VISPENGGIIFANNILPFNNFTSKKKNRNFNKKRRLSSMKIQLISDMSIPQALHILLLTLRW
jgi:hypothetical protein